MESNKNRNYLIPFVLLFLTYVVRSGTIVDKSFTPRLLLLSVLLLPGFIWMLKKKARPQLNFLTISFFVFSLWTFLSCFWANTVSEAVVRGLLVFAGLGVFLLSAYFLQQDPGLEKKITRLQLLVLGFSLLLAFYQLVNSDKYSPYQIISISANKNLYSGFLLLSLPFTLTGYMQWKSNWRYAILLTGILSAVMLFMLQSTSANIALVLAVALLIAVVCIKYRGLLTGSNIITATLSLCLYVALTTIFYSGLEKSQKDYYTDKFSLWRYSKLFAPPKVTSDTLLVQKEGSENISSTDMPEDYTQSARLRVIFWKRSLSLIKQHPLMGVGAGNWKIIIPSIVTPQNPEHTLRNYTYSQPHNEWLCFLSELGIIGFILAIGVFIFPIVFVFGKILFAKEAPPVSALFYAAFISGFYLYCIFDFPLQRVEHTILLSILLALVLHKIPLKPVGTNIFKQIASASIHWIFIIVLSFAAVFSVYRFTCETYTREIFSNERRNDDQVIYYCQKAEGALYKITPNTLPVAWFEGVARFRLHQNEKANECFKRALKYTPYEVRVLNDYATSLFSLKDTSEAIKVLHTTLHIDPDFDDAKFNLAAMYYFSGQKDSARHYVLLCRNSQKKTDFLSELPPQ